jgi:hypothetical protein
VVIRDLANASQRPFEPGGAQESREERALADAAFQLEFVSRLVHDGALWLAAAAVVRERLAQNLGKGLFLIFDAQKYWGH